MSGTYPIYRKSKSSGMIVKFMGIKMGYVIDPGTSDNETGSLHTDWRHYNADCWKPYDYVDSGAITTATVDIAKITKTKTPDQLELFETTSIKISSLKDTSITRVPNGYVMTSSSGHQLFIKDLSKDSL